MLPMRRVGGIPLSAVPVCQIYDEPSFRVLLAVERARARALGRSALLVLITCRPSDGRGTGAASLGEALECLARTVRETDFAGWLRQGRVAAAVLVQDSETIGAALRRAVARRTAEELDRVVPAHEASRLRVRTCALNPASGEVSDGC